MSTMKTVRYEAFGKLLLKRRQQAGIVQQSDLAVLMNTTQQSVSRWESGISRPRDRQLPLLAKVIKTDVDELLTAAGYTRKVTVASFDQPFPLEALNPDSFERFCFYFLESLYPSPARVHRAGGSGHKQEGLDICVVFADESCITFQCKRVTEFGPQKVHAVAEQHKRKAREKYILLSRVASPQARIAVGEHKSWDIWDKEDISLRIRRLSKDEQKRIVDTFFSGQRLALLGEFESGPWQTTKEFFAPFMSERSMFNHAWALVGRIDETDKAFKGLSNVETQAVILVGAGGTGKSRVLKNVIEIFESSHKDVLIRFFSPIEQVTNKSLEDLGDRQKVLVVDDAHDRGDLDLLFRYASIRDNKTTLIIASRPYAIDYIQARASIYSLVGERILEVRLNPLTIEEATDLAVQVLKAFGGSVGIAKDIARITRDCPLITVIGAQIMSKEKVSFELAKNETSFRSTVLGKFQDIITGELGNKRDSKAIKSLLRILALLQPFHPGDASVYEIALHIEGLDRPQVSRLIRLLTVGGGLFKRGGQYRLSPDVLADYVIEDNCIGLDGRSTGYAERVFEVAGDTYTKHILLNLGKLDWRRSNGDPSNSNLLDGVWGKLRPEFDYSDPHVAAVTAVAFYQPSRALDFAEHLIREKKYLDQLPDLVRNTAYNLEYLPRACECLWELGKNDARPLSPNPDHALRILTELSAVERKKPLKYNKRVLEFGLSLINKKEAWEHQYSPLDILRGILRTEGDSTTSDGRSILFHPFLVSPSAVSSIRNEVIDAALGLLIHPNTSIAVRAASFLGESIHYPIGMFGIEIPPNFYNAWTDEFIRILEKIESVIQYKKIEVLVLIELFKSVSWHAFIAERETSMVAQRIINSAPDCLEFRTTLSLVDGYGHIFQGKSTELHRREWSARIDALADELVSSHTDAENLLAYISDRLSHIRTNYIARSISPHILYLRLLEKSIDFAYATIENALIEPESSATQFAAAALSVLLAEDHSDGLQYANRILASGSSDMHAAVGIALSSLKSWQPNFTEEDIALLRELLTFEEDRVIQNAVAAVQIVARKDPRIAIELVMLVDVGMSCETADCVFSIFETHGSIPFGLLSPDDIDHFFKKLMRLPKLDGYWLDTFLSNCSQYHARRTAKFFMARVEHALNTQNWDYRPCNFGPYSHVPLSFHESPKLSHLLREVARWMVSREDDNSSFHYHAAQLFGAIFLPFDGIVLDFLQGWIDAASSSDLHVIMQVLGEVPADFVFANRVFVAHFLERTALFGKDMLDRASSVLWRAAISGGRTGTPGEPFPEDLQIKEKAEKAMNEVPRFAPAFKLYESLKRHADQEIQQSSKELVRFEE